MTALTLHLSDALVSQAKQQGVFNEQALNAVLCQYLSQQVHQKAAPNVWQQFFAERHRVQVPAEFMSERYL